MSDAAPPPQAVRVFRAEDACVVSGANLGDGLDAWEQAVEGDVYRLQPGADALEMLLARAPLPNDGAAAREARQKMAVAAGSPLGAEGDAVALSLRLSLMSAEGDTVELLGLEHRPAAGRLHPARYLLPLSPLARGAEYTLLRLERDPAVARLSDILCVALARGTRITLPDGRQRPVEALEPGDRVLTRDHGPQPLRWIGRATLRAHGSFAPVVIGAGLLGNTADLVVGQHHRILLYRRDRPGGAATAELLVQARHLVDGTRVFLREGGLVDYYSLVFDRHEIVYAEGLPAESLLVNEATLSRLPEPIAEEMHARLPGLSQSMHFGTEAGRAVLDAIGRDRLLGGSDGG